MKMDTPSYWAVIPAKVRYSNLKPSAKLLYGEITCLQNKTGYCFATNRYFSELYGVTKNTVSSWVSQLEKMGFITVELERNQHKQIIKRKIGITENGVTPLTNNGEDNITRVNNTSINNITIREQKFLNSVSLLEYDLELKKEFCDYWCEKNPSKNKMRFELCKTFDVDLRLKRWVKNNEMWNKKTTEGKHNYLKAKGRIENQYKSRTETNINVWKNARNMLDNLET